jgi:hypothetical protein
MSDQKQLPLDCQQSKMTLKALRAEAKKAGVKNYSKLSRDFLIDAIAKQTEQNNISDAVALFPPFVSGSPANKETESKNETKDVFDTDTPEAKGQPEPVPVATTIPPPVTPEKKERKTRKKKDTKSNDPDCSLTVVHIDSPATETDPEAPAPAPKKKGPNKWQLHVQAFRSEHPELSYKNAMTEAKKTYQA